MGWGAGVVTAGARGALALELPRAAGTAKKNQKIKKNKKIERKQLC